MTDRAALLRQAEEAEKRRDEMVRRVEYRRENLRDAESMEAEHRAEAARLRAEVARIDAEQAKAQPIDYTLNIGARQSQRYVRTDGSVYVQNSIDRAITVQITSDPPAPVPPASVGTDSRRSSVSEAERDAERSPEAHMAQEAWDSVDLNGKTWYYQLTAPQRKQLRATLAAAFPLLYRDRLVTVWDGLDEWDGVRRTITIGNVTIAVDLPDFLRALGAEGV